MKLREVFDSKPEKISWNKHQDGWTGGFEINEIPFVFFIARDDLPIPSADDKDNSNSFEVAFAVDNGQLQQVLKTTTNPALEKMKSNSWSDVSGVIGTGSQGKVFSTVLNGLKDFVKSVKPEFIFFSANMR